MPFADSDPDVLRALGTHDLSPDSRGRVRARAHAALARGRQPDRPSRVRLRAAYDRVIEPTLLGSLVAIQLAWAAHRALLLL